MIYVYIWPDLNIFHSLTMLTLGHKTHMHDSTPQQNTKKLWLRQKFVICENEKMVALLTYVNKYWNTKPIQYNVYSHTQINWFNGSIEFIYVFFYFIDIVSWCVRVTRMFSNVINKENSRICMILPAINLISIQFSQTAQTKEQ